MKNSTVKGSSIASSSGGYQLDQLVMRNSKNVK